MGMDPNAGNCTRTCISKQLAKRASHTPAYCSVLGQLGWLLHHEVE